MPIYNRIRDLREDKDITQAEMGKTIKFLLIIF